MKSQLLLCASALAALMLTGCHPETEGRVNGISSGDYGYVMADFACMPSEQALDELTLALGQKDMAAVERLSHTAGVTPMTQGAVAKIVHMNLNGKAELQTKTAQNCWAPSSVLSANAPVGAAKAN